MAYSKEVIDHYENPRNAGSMDEEDPAVGTGMVGAPACGDVMKLQLRIGDDGIIADAKFKTFGCGSAIAASSLATEWVTGGTIEKALGIRNQEIARELALSPIKVHCSVLAESAIKKAIADFLRKRRERGESDLGDRVLGQARTELDLVLIPADETVALARVGGIGEERIGTFQQQLRWLREEREGDDPVRMRLALDLFRQQTEDIAAAID